MQITDRLVKEFPKLRELLPIFNPYEVKVVKRDPFNSTFIMLEDANGNGYTVKNGIIYVVKPENGGGRNDKGFRSTESINKTIRKELRKAGR